MALACLIVLATDADRAARARLAPGANECALRGKLPLCTDLAAPGLIATAWIEVSTYCELLVGAYLVSRWLVGTYSAGRHTPLGLILA